jgi:predicted ester cyclase
MKLFILIGFCLLPYDSKSQSHDLVANKNLVRNYFEEVVKKKNLTALDRFCTPVYVGGLLNDGTSERKTLEQHRKFLEYLFKAFPDLYYTFTDVVAEGDQVMVRAIFHGTHKDEFLGVPGSGRRIDFLSEIFLFRIEAGKIAGGAAQLDFDRLFKLMKGEK